jgi:hypothetical protein
MKKCKWWHKIFTVWSGESKETKTLLSPDMPKYIVHWYNEYKCHICNKTIREYVKHNFPVWGEK